MYILANENSFENPNDEFVQSENGLVVVFFVCVLRGVVVVNLT